MRMRQQFSFWMLSLVATTVFCQEAVDEDIGTSKLVQAAFREHQVSSQETYAYQEGKESNGILTRVANYDSLGNLLEELWWSGLHQEPQRTFMTYDQDGNILSSIVIPPGKPMASLNTSYVRDNVGRVISKVLRNQDRVISVEDFEYDAKGKLVKTMRRYATNDQNQGNLHYYYDHTGREILRTELDHKGVPTRYFLRYRNEAGDLVAITRIATSAASVVTDSFGYDESHRCTQMSTYSQEGEVIFRKTLTYGTGVLLEMESTNDYVNGSIEVKEFDMLGLPRQTVIYQNGKQVALLTYVYKRR